MPVQLFHEEVLHFHLLFGFRRQFEYGREILIRDDDVDPRVGVFGA